MEQTNFLTLDQEIELGELTKRGCLESKEKFLKAYENLVLKLAFRHKGNFELDDIVQEGTMGLITAIDRYDYTRGLKLSSSAVPWIIQKMQRYKRNNHTIRTPCHIHDRWLKAEKLKEEYKDKGTVLSKEELEEKLGHKVINPYNAFTSLDEKAKGQDKGSYSEVVPDKVNVESDVLSTVTKQELISIMGSCLKEKEIRVIQLRYGFGGNPQTFDQVAKVFGLSRERIRQIQVKAEEKLKKELIKINYERF